MNNILVVSKEAKLSLQITEETDRFLQQGLTPAYAIAVQRQRLTSCVPNHSHVQERAAL